MRLRVFLFAALPLTVLAGTVNLTLDFTPNQFVFDKVSGFDVVALPGQYSTSVPGEPNLPLAVYNIVIPPDAEVTGIEVTDVEWMAVSGEYLIHPSQRLQVLSKPALAFVEPDNRAYRSHRPYPAEVAAVTHSGCAGGYRVAGVQFAPMRYLPAQRKLELARRVRLEVGYEQGRHDLMALDETQVDLAAGYLRGLVANRQDLGRWQPHANLTDGWTCDMMVITSTSLAGSFQPFADWKTRQGIKTAIVKTESIYSTWPGRDNQEKIRNCVIDYWQNHGLKWLLLGGDDDIVPVRTARITCEGNEGDIATDLYYADLQGSWDSNHNDLFGEMSDSVDLLYDIFVGRTPVDDAGDVAVFFAKDTMFERHQDTTRLKNVLLGSGMLFPPYHGKVLNRMIADLFPSGWQFNHLESPPDGAYANAMSQGYQLAHVAAHGNPATFSVMDITEVAGLTNGLTKLNFVSSIACMPGWFDDEECFAEELVKAPNGGCVACALNSRYGFGYPPGFGPSDMLDLQFYRNLSNKDASQFSALNAMAKDHFQSLVRGQEAWRWCAYELNLFGDPTLSAWTEQPGNLNVTCADSALTGPQAFRVVVKDGATPLPGALVCLHKGTETYARGYTNSQGLVELLISPTSTGDLNLSVTAPNHYPYEVLVPVRGTAAGPALVFAGYRVVDTDGNGRLDPGETADLYVSIANLGAASATGVTARLREDSPYLSLADSSSDYGTIPAGDTVEGDLFQLSADASTPAGTAVELVAAVTADQGTYEPWFETRIGETNRLKGLWLDHDTGEVILSVTSLGSIGTLGPYKEGSGMKYPRDAVYGSLYFSSLACGTDPDYVVDRWYGHPSTTYNTDWQVVDTLAGLVPPAWADEEYRAVISDAGHPAPKGLHVTQWSGAVTEPGYRDFVIIEYTLENAGAGALNGLCCGIFSDFDVLNTTENQVVSDAGRRLTYMMQAPDSGPKVGVKLLRPTTPANQSAIDHAVYLNPTNMLTEAAKDSFLQGGIQMPNSNRNANWSCVVSAGPFDLAPGERQIVAFAMVGANSESDLCIHADSAQSWYDFQMPRGLAYLRHTIDDSPPGGNGDGIINPGESINLPLWVQNSTGVQALGVEGILRKDGPDTLVTITDSARYFGTVEPKDSAWTGTEGFGFRVSESCPDRYQLPVKLVCTDTLGSSYVSFLPLQVGRPVLAVGELRCWDYPPEGNRNGKLDPGEQTEVGFGLTNTGLGNADSVVAKLRSLDARLLVLDSIGGYGLVGAGSTVFNSTDRFELSADSLIPAESQLPCSLFVTADRYQASWLVLVDVGVTTGIDPVPDGPRVPSRYYAYDNVDSFYTHKPTFAWSEIRSIGTRIDFPGNDRVVTVNLPSGFGPFFYYGQSYDQVSISADGWIVPGAYDTSDCSNNELPSPEAPPGVICGNWDDLYPGYHDENYAYYYHDAANNRFVIEFDSVPYYSPRTAKDKFEFLLYDTTMAGPTGDNVIDVQYLTANNYGSSTVGIQDMTRTIGIQCLYNGTYNKAAAQIAPGRAIRYTTLPPATGIEGQWTRPEANRLELRAAPNPMAGQGLIHLALPQPGHVRLVVLDVVGRLVRTITDARLDQGRHSLVWDRRDDVGRRVAAGVYLLRLATDTGTVTHKAVLLR